MWTHGDIKIWRFAEKGYEIGDMVYGIRIRDKGIKEFRRFEEFKGF